MLLAIRRVLAAFDTEFRPFDTRARQATLFPNVHHAALLILSELYRLLAAGDIEH